MSHFLAATQTCLLFRKSAKPVQWQQKKGNIHVRAVHQHTQTSLPRSALQHLWTCSQIMRSFNQYLRIPSSHSGWPTLLRAPVGPEHQTNMDRCLCAGCGPVTSTCPCFKSMENLVWWHHKHNIVCHGEQAGVAAVIMINQGTVCYAYLGGAGAMRHQSH